ncbi:ATP-grasp domain-containing protein [Corynebacterium poyangense]|uniref:ATP-grasp domain-containing protein n=1 Tax=Corynebacterium poyangense TaxID=2684405 RepID=A0A7H0SN88_9CORY|nr:ATP-grasp domain-containing protein [Corynebacterium poyangense]MBZ8177035.1 ATP-grasp domain-containing protein [Corynebacterium poyangense]QNQ90013.1 ATP-grasp domain-containing protein [Corynebacterium poyangense]
MRESIIILGASVLQIPLIKKAADLGYRTVVLDRNSNADGRFLCDEFFEISTVDRVGVEKVAERIDPVAIITAATDLPINVISSVSKKLGLKSIGPDCARRCTNKAEMMGALKSVDLAIPRYTVVSSYDDFRSAAFELASIDSSSDLASMNECKAAFDPDILIKPVDCSGSRGVVKIASLKDQDLRFAWKYSTAASTYGKFIVSEFMHGPEVSVEMFMEGGRVRFAEITDKATTGSPEFVEIGHSQPCMLAADIQENILTLAEDAVDVLGIDEGPAHVEIIVDREETPRIVEVGARLGGDFITSHLVPLSTGVDLLAATINHACGKRADFRRTKQQGTAIRYILPYFNSDRFAKCGNHVVKGVVHAHLPETISALSEGKLDSASRIGEVICTGKDVNEARQRCLQWSGEKIW